MLVRTAVEIRQLDRSFLWIVPASTPTGSYWFRATYQATTNIVGFGPYSDGIPGNGAFNVNLGDACGEHSSCTSSEYCDVNAQCRKCIECQQWNDAIDFACPSKCGGDLPLDVSDTIPTSTEGDTVGPMNNYILPDCPDYYTLVNSSNLLLDYEASTATIFPRLMTVRMRNKLDDLVEAFHTDAQNRFVGLQMKVTMSYKIAPTTSTGAPLDTSDVSLHYEGRTSVVTLVRGYTCYFDSIACYSVLRVWIHRNVMKLSIWGRLTVVQILTISCCLCPWCRSMYQTHPHHRAIYRCNRWVGWQRLWGLTGSFARQRPLCASRCCPRYSTAHAHLVALATCMQCFVQRFL